ncbi:MAG: hypothetical protein HY820_19705 [Acidobacteria bacterium]|nr:hypothetical protein [Acidobacteriota bacterium]
MTFVLLVLVHTLSAEVIAVGEKHSDTVSFYEGETGRVIQRVKVGHKPHELVLAGDNRHLFVADYGLTRWTEPDPGGRTVTVIDTANYQVTAKIDLGAHRRPHGIELGPSGNIYVVCGRPGAVLVIDPAQRKIVREIPVEGKDPHMIAILPDESKLYVANASSGNVTVVAGARQKQIEIGGVPMGMALTRDGKTLYATNRTGNAVAEIDTGTDTVRAFHEISGEPVRARLVQNDRFLLITTIVAGDLAVMNTRSKQVLHRVHVGNQLEGIAISPDEKYVYVSAQADNFVQRLTAGDWRLQNQIRTAERPDPIAVLPR